MLSNDKYIFPKKNETTKSIYTSLRYLAGKRGYEMYRFCGLSGQVSALSDIDIFHVLRDQEGSLPSKVWANITMHDIDRYYVGYVKCNPHKNACKYACPKHCPQRDGGLFKMPEMCLSKHPLLAEF